MGKGLSLLTLSSLMPSSPPSLALSPSLEPRACFGLTWDSCFPSRLFSVSFSAYQFIARSQCWYARYHIVEQFLFFFVRR